MAMLGDIKIMMLKGEKGDKGDGSYDDTEIKAMIAQETADREAEIAEMERNFLNYLYPVGSIYMSVENTSPAVLFGGTWSQIEGKFLLASSSSHSNGSTGGAESVNYTPQGSVNDHTLTANEIPLHTHGYWTAENTVSILEGTSSTVIEGVCKTLQKIQTDSQTSGGQGHNHGFTGTQGTIATMPPYLAVNVWKRTA